MRKFTGGLKVFFFLLIVTLTFNSIQLKAQQTSDFNAERDRAIQLVNENKFAQALPILEKLAADKKADGQIFLGLGLVHWRMQDAIFSDKAKWKQTRLKAREAFLKAKELGTSLPEVDLILASIKPNGDDKSASDNPQASAASEEAFEAFKERDYKKAAVEYEKAANLDPTWYEAALYTGNSFYALKEHDKAAVWFAKAIALDPNRETAHRYWADSLMQSGKNKEAEVKFIDAINAEPYSSAAWRGLTQYAGRSNIKLSHPKISVPVDFSASENGNTKITLGNLTGGKDEDGSFAWTMYGISRALWQTDKEGKLSDKFAKTYPGERVYRHSLAEETEALRMVLSALKNDKKIKKVDSSLTLLKKIDTEGLLEAYILYARSDAGIRQDYTVYRQNNRDKLRRYLTEYVMKNGGN
jgi:tetratricopeptide (TPR) repeat protein